MSSNYDHYINLMSFISKAIGPDFEISLIDTKDGKNRIIAMEYGNISGRHVGEEISPLLKKSIENKEYETTDYIANRTTYAKSGKPLRTSVFFIKDEDNNLEGIMCINFDDSRYEELGKKIMFLCHPDYYTEHRITKQSDSSDINGDYKDVGESMTIEETIESIVDNELNEVLIPVERLTQDEKIQIVKNLDNKGVFMMKGSVGIFSKKLDVSQASVYRYINIARGEE